MAPETPASDEDASSMIPFENRLERERRTVEAMVRLYCRGLHGSGHDLCRDCSELLGYVEQRLARCPFCEGKPACSECPIHCYRTTSRAQIRTVMRYAGPRMLLRHPILAFFHWIDARKQAPEALPETRRAAPAPPQATPCPHCDTGPPSG